MAIHKLLKDNGWKVECESPFEIRHEDGSFATMNAADSVVNELRLLNKITKIRKLSKKYLNNNIGKDEFIDKVIDVL